MKRQSTVPARQTVWTQLLTGALLLLSGILQADQFPVPADGWRLVTDGVMGGVSTGALRIGGHQADDAVCLSGSVSTANNGGFIQLALDIDPQTAGHAPAYEGVAFRVSGNGETYNMHLRSSDLWLPWQSYRASFVAGAEWTVVKLPFSAFEPYKTGAALRPERLKRIGIVAIGRDFAADVCVRNLAFYRPRD